MSETDAAAAGIVPSGIGPYRSSKGARMRSSGGIKGTIALITGHGPAKAGAIGEGAVHRLARTIQRKYWEPPQFREGEPARRG